MRKIKFRGRDIETGKQIIYGNGYAELNGKKYIFDEKFGIAYHIEPDSVSQLIGCDSNGAEVYEGDPVKRIKYWEDDYVLDFHGYVDCDGKIFQASFSDFDAILNGEIVKMEA